MGLIDQFRNLGSALQPKLSSDMMSVLEQLRNGKLEGVGPATRIDPIIKANGIDSREEEARLVSPYEGDDVLVHYIRREATTGIVSIEQTFTAVGDGKYDPKSIISGRRLIPASFFQK